MSTANNLAVLIILSISGWLEFVHHFEIVVWSFPSCSASHLPVFFFSTSTNFIRFKSLFAIFLVCMSVCNNQDTKIKLFYEIPPQPTKKLRRIYNYMTYVQFSIVFSTAHFSPYLCPKKAIHERFFLYTPNIRCPHPRHPRLRSLHLQDIRSLQGGAQHRTNHHQRQDEVHPVGRRQPYAVQHHRPHRPHRV